MGRKFERLTDLMYTLRSRDGCPWDRAQSVKDLKQYVLEESYEVLEAMDEENLESLSEELGDLMFQIVFLGQMMQERKLFTILEVLEQVTDKMIGRHPHVFGGVRAESPEQALESWEAMKSRGVGRMPAKKSVLEGVPKNLPALLQAYLISSKVARVGFDWETVDQVWEKFEEEMKEFHTAPSRKRKEEEIGDLFFTLVNIARKSKINPEDALRMTNAKFRRRFEQLERKVQSQNRKIKDLKMEEMDTMWEEVKVRMKRRS